jgi:AhpD family alkylhydroperoxidase
VNQIQVFDPPMCCSTGVCGPSVDPALVRFAADLDWLKANGIAAERFNLAQQPGTFVESEVVRTALEEEGNDCLPLIVVEGQIVSRAIYPDRDTLAKLAGLPDTGGPSLFSPQVQELVAIGAAIAANCEPCLKFHYDKARKLGVSEQDMHAAVAVALAVKETPARAMVDLAGKLLKRRVEAAAPGTVGDCCAPTVADSGDGCCS